MKNAFYDLPKRQVLVTAYAINPYRGSEDGTGWHIVRTLSEENTLTVITRCNNQAAIEHYRAAHPEVAPTVNFQYYDLPVYLRWWKRGSRGALLYHYLWHLGVVWFIWRQQFQFEVAHHLNFHADWCPSFLWLLGKPFVWGPIGHHPKFPTGYLPHHSTSTRLAHRLRWGIKRLFWHYDPFLTISKKRAAAILAVNSDVGAQLSVAPHKLHQVPAIATETPSIFPIIEDDGIYRVLSVGRFCALKGFDVTIAAFVHFYRQLVPADRHKVKLTLIGKGRDEKLLRQQLAQAAIPAENWEIIPWLDRSELDTYFRLASVFLFPSHEGAGMVIPEAMSYGIPVLCYDNIGPGETVGPAAGIRIPYTTYQESVTDFAEALLTLFLEPTYREDLGQAGIERHVNHYHWEVKAQQINAIYAGCLTPVTSPSTPIQPRTNPSPYVQA